MDKSPRSVGTVGSWLVRSRMTAIENKGGTSACQESKGKGCTWATLVCLLRLRRTKQETQERARCARSPGRGHASTLVGTKERRSRVAGALAQVHVLPASCGGRSLTAPDKMETREPALDTAAGILGPEQPGPPESCVRCRPAEAVRTLKALRRQRMDYTPAEGAGTSPDKLSDLWYTRSPRYTVVGGRLASSDVEF